MKDRIVIDKILSELGDIWQNYPYLRLGQLLLNVMSETTLYYIDDEKLITMVEDYYRNIGADN